MNYSCISFIIVHANQRNITIDPFFSAGYANLYSLPLLNMKREIREGALSLVLANIWQVNALSGVGSS